MENTPSDYLSFVRGFLAATDGAACAQDGPGGVDPDSYAEGYAAGAYRGGYPVTYYRELSVQDDGRFTGTLDLDLPEWPAEPAEEELPVLSGTLDLA